MERISKINQELNGAKGKEPKYVDSALSWLGFDSMLPESSQQLIKKLRPILESDKVYKRMVEYVEKSEFPTDIVPLVRDLDIGKHNYAGKFGAVGGSPWDKFAVLLELGRVDASLATFFMVQHGLMGKTIDMFGSEEMKNEWMPKIINLEVIGGWGLTEQHIGSDASNMSTRVREENGEYILNGNKRWIGNANKDIMVVFAKDEKTEEVQCFLIDLTWAGIKREKIQNKLALRSVQNMQLWFDNVRIPAKNKLPGVKGFGSVAALLAESRLLVAWLATAMSVGLYDYLMKYVTKRQQFGKPITAYQLIQEKIFKVMSIAQSNLFLCHQLTKLHVEGKASIGQIAMAKAFCTDQLRESARHARAALGGNGIISDNHVMRTLIDAEVLFTYEGTYDINLLVTGRELTGIAAFKTR